MIDHRIEAYAKRLRWEVGLDKLVLVDVVLAVHRQLFLKSKEYVKPLDLNNSGTYINLNLKFSDYFNEKFWLDSAEWICSRLDIWKETEEIQEKRIDDTNNAILLPAYPLPGYVSEEIQSDPEIQLISARAFIVAQDLIKRLSLSSLPIEAMKALLGIVPEKPTFIPQPQLFLKGSKEPIIAAPPVRTTNRSLLQLFNWQQDLDDKVSFLDSYSAGRIELFINELDPETQEYIRFTGKAAWGIISQFEEFGEDTAKLHFILSAYAFQQSRPWAEPFKLSGTSLINELRWDARKDLTKTIKMNRIDHCLKLLRRLDSTIKWDIGKLSCDGNYQIWQIDINRYGQRNPDTQNVDNPSELEITVRAGNWPEFFFNKQGRKTKQALYEFGWLNESTLKIQCKIARRIAMHLTADSANHKTGKYSVRELLEIALGKSAIESARSVVYKAQDIREQWDKTIKLLAEDWVIELEEKPYPEWLRPGSQAQNPPGLRAKSIDVLLEAAIIFTARCDIEVQNTCNEDSEPKKRSSTTESTLKWEPIQKACEALGWTKQAIIAKNLGISQQLVSQLQRGKPISTQTAAKLREALAIVLPGLAV